MDFTILAQTPLFQGIPAEELEKIFAVLNISKNCFRKGEMLAMQDELVNRLIILTRGSVKAEMTDPSGKLIKVEDIEAPNPLAILFLFGNHNRFPVQARPGRWSKPLSFPSNVSCSCLQPMNSF